MSSVRYPDLFGAKGMPEYADHLRLLSTDTAHEMHEFSFAHPLVGQNRLLRSAAVGPGRRVMLVLGALDLPPHHWLRGQLATSSFQVLPEISFDKLLFGLLHLPSFFPSS